MIDSKGINPDKDAPSPSYFRLFGLIMQKSLNDLIAGVDVSLDSRFPNTSQNETKIRPSEALSGNTPSGKTTTLEKTFSLLQGSPSVIESMFNGKKLKDYGTCVERLKVHDILPVIHSH